MVIAYIKHNAIYALVFFYLVASVLLESFTGIDICIPCLVKLTTGYTCPGCGFTTATIALTQFDFTSAWNANKLIFIVLPALAWYVGNDFYRFRKS